MVNRASFCNFQQYSQVAFIYIIISTRIYKLYLYLPIETSAIFLSQLLTPEPSFSENIKHHSEQRNQQHRKNYIHTLPESFILPYFHLIEKP